MRPQAEGLGGALWASDCPKEIPEVPAGVREIPPEASWGALRGGEGRGSARSFLSELDVRASDSEAQSASTDSRVRPA